MLSCLRTKFRCYMLVLFVTLSLFGCVEKEPEVAITAPPQIEMRVEPTHAAQMQTKIAATVTLDKSPQTKSTPQTVKPNTGHGNTAVHQEAATKVIGSQATAPTPHTNSAVPTLPTATPAAEALSSSQAKEEGVSVSITGPVEVGVLLPDTTVKIVGGETAFSVMLALVKEKNIQIDYTGKNSSVYVKGIGNIYEFDFGAKSGWMYQVNGVLKNMGAGAYVLKKGDELRWLYTKDFGNDL